MALEGRFACSRSGGAAFCGLMGEDVRSIREGAGGEPEQDGSLPCGSACRVGPERVSGDEHAKWSSLRVGLAAASRRSISHTQDDSHARCSAQVAKVSRVPLEDESYTLRIR